MKKKTITLFTLIPLLAACNNSASGPINPIPYVEPEPEVRSDELYLGFSDYKVYYPSKDVDFVVTVNDQSIVSYDKSTQTFSSGTKAGTTLAVFSSSKLTVNVTVIVKDDGTAPLFALDESYLDLNVSDSYIVNASLSFRGVDGFDASSGLHYHLVDKDVGSSSVTINGKQITIKANSVGTDVYTFYTEYAGLTLSKNLTVNVIENKAFVVIGKNISFDDEGKPLYRLSMYGYDEHPINLKDDLTVSKGGVSIDYDDLTIDVLTTDIISIVDDKILVHKTGNGVFKINYRGDEQEINVFVYKPVIERKTIELEDEQFALNLGFSKSSGTRSYQGSKEVKKLIPLDDKTYTYEKAASVTVNGKERFATEDTPITYSSDTITVTAASFDIDCAGEKDVVLKMEADTFYVEYEFSMFFITKELSTKKDLDDYLTMISDSDVIFGYYKLINDVDYFNYYPAQDYIKGADKSYLGFRGTLDGTNPEGGNFKLMNIKSSIYGICITIGSGAVLRNVDFDNIYLNNRSKTSALASFIFDASFYNININLSDNSVVDTIGPDNDPCASGIISCQKVQDSYFDNLVINAQKHTIHSFIGKTATNNIYTDCVINCVDIIYYNTNTTFDPVTLLPTRGVMFATTSIDGITINKTIK